MVDNPSLYPMTDHRFWSLGPQLRQQFDEHRQWADQTLRGLDAETRRGVFETESVYNYGWGALGHVTRNDANAVAGWSGRQAAIQLAMRADPAAPDPGDPFRRAAQLPDPGHPRDVGLGDTWWQRERFNAYQSGAQSMRDDIARLNQPEIQALVSDIRSHDTGRNGFLDADVRLREQFGSLESRGASAPMARLWVEGRQEALREWLGRYPADGQAASAALGGQLAPGSTPRTAPTASNTAGHRYPATGADRDQRGR